MGSEMCIRDRLEPGRDFEASCGRARAPLLVLRGTDDVLCSTEAVEAAGRCWGGQVTVRQVPGYGHVDLVYAPGSGVDVFAAALAWLDRGRHVSWGDVEDVA